MTKEQDTEREKLVEALDRADAEQDRIIAEQDRIIVESNRANAAWHRADNALREYDLKGEG